ncbi:Adenylosuccinate synthetase [Trichinella pseudospiralis]
MLLAGEVCATLLRLFDDLSDLHKDLNWKPFVCLDEILIFAKIVKEYLWRLQLYCSAYRMAVGNSTWISVTFFRVRLNFLGYLDWCVVTPLIRIFSPYSSAASSITEFLTFTIFQEPAISLIGELQLLLIHQLSYVHFFNQTLVNFRERVLLTLQFILGSGPETVVVMTRNVEVRNDREATSRACRILTTLCVIVVHSEPNLYDWYQNSGSLERFLQELREKRKPSIGLSLAEYMADPERSQDFHFLRGRKKRTIQFYNS